MQSVLPVIERAKSRGAWIRSGLRTVLRPGEAGVGGWQISRAEPPSVMGTWGGQTPGGGSSTRKVKTIFSWGWQRAAQSGGEGGGFQPSPKGWTPQYQGAFERRWHLWPPLRAQSGPPRHPRRAEECRLQVPLGRLSGALANQTFPAKPPRSSPKSPCRCYRKLSEKRRRPLRVPVRRPRSLSRYTRALRSRAVAGSPRGGGPGACVCVCWEGGPPRGRRSASASPPPARTARPCPRKRPEPPRSSLAFASRVSYRPPSPGRAPEAAAERLPAGERLRACTGAGGGGPVRGSRAGERRARRRRPPSPRSLARSPPPALRSFPPLPGVIDPSRAPPLPPPRPF